MWYNKDVDFNDLERARKNREMVSQKLNTVAYIQVENALKGYPTTNELPSWMPRDNLVYVNLEELRKLLKIDEDML